MIYATFAPGPDRKLVFGDNVIRQDIEADNFEDAVAKSFAQEDPTRAVDGLIEIAEDFYVLGVAREDGLFAVVHAHPFDHGESKGWNIHLAPLFEDGATAPVPQSDSVQAGRG